MTLREGSSLYYATRHLDDDVRARVTSLLVLFDTLATAVTDVQEPQVAEKKIHWWHEEIDRLYQHEARHPHTKSLQPWITQACPDKAPWLSVLAVNNQMRFVNTETESALEQQLIDDYGSRLTIVNSVLTPVTDSQKESDMMLPGTPPQWARPYSLGLGHVDKLINFNRLYQQGHIAFAEESWQRAALKPEAARETDNKQALDNLLHAIISRAQAHLGDGIEAISQVPAPMLKLLWTLTALRQQQLTLWQRKNHNPLNASMSLTPAAKAWRAWRTEAKADRLLRQ